MKTYHKIIVGIVFLSLIFGVNPAFCQEESKEEIANQIKKREKDLEEYKKIESRLKHYLDPENDFFFLLKRDSYIPIRIEDKQKLMEEIKNMAYAIKSLSNVSKKDIDFAAVMIQMEIEAEHDAIQRRLKDDLGVIRENIKAVNKDIERLKDKERKVALSKPSGEVSGPWVKGWATVGRDPIDQIAGAWSFGRIVDKKKVFLCNLTLTKELTDKGYVINSCHRNESFWEMDGTTTINFKNKNGEVTSTLNRINDKYWEGPYQPPKDMPMKEDETAKPHYIERQ